MTLIQLTSASFKTPVSLHAELVFAVWYSDASKSTYVMSTGGAIVPVLETKEQVEDLLKITKESM